MDKPTFGNGAGGQKQRVMKNVSEEEVTWIIRCMMRAGPGLKGRFCDQKETKRILNR